MPTASAARSGAARPAAASRSRSSSRSSRRPGPHHAREGAARAVRPPETARPARRAGRSTCAPARRRAGPGPPSSSTSRRSGAARRHAVTASCRAQAYAYRGPARPTDGDAGFSGPTEDGLGPFAQAPGWGDEPRPPRAPAYRNPYDDGSPWWDDPRPRRRSRRGRSRLLLGRANHLLRGIRADASASDDRGRRPVDDGFVLRCDCGVPRPRRPVGDGARRRRLEPGTIVFSDHRSDEPTDPATGLIRFEDWARARPAQKPFLNLYPTYAEPVVNVTNHGVTKRRQEKLQMYVVEARFSVRRPPGAIDLARYVTLAFLERIDPAIRHRTIAAADAAPDKDAEQPYNRRPDRRWCEAAGRVACIEIALQLEGKLPIGVRARQQARGRRTRRSPTRSSSRASCGSCRRRTSTSRAPPADRRRRPGRRRARAEHVLRQPGHALRQAPGGVPAQSGGRQEHDHDRDDRARGRLQHARPARRSTRTCRCCGTWCRRRCCSATARSTPAISISAGLPSYVRNRIKAIAGILERD